MVNQSILVAPHANGEHPLHNVVSVKNRSVDWAHGQVTFEGKSYQLNIYFSNDDEPRLVESNRTGYKLLDFNLVSILVISGLYELVY